MSRPGQILEDAKVELCEAEAHLVRAEESRTGGNAPNATEFKRHALNSAHSAMKRLQLFERQLENELFERS